MTTPTLEDEVNGAPDHLSWLTRPLSAWWCALGWLAATAVFGGLTKLLHGPNVGDAVESVYSTWAIAHGHWSCAYPAGGAGNLAFGAPLYPLLAGAVAWMSRIGDSAPFPSTAQMGPHCSNAVNAMYQWSLRSNSIWHTLNIGYLSWLALMAGIIVLLRASGRGKCGWEPTALLIVACLPPVFMCVQYTFHPQDLVAMGFALAALGCGRCDRWIWAGVLIGLALMTQQYAVLVAAPLFVMTPRSRRVTFVLSGACAVAALSLPLAVATSGHVLRAIFVGTGNTPSFGGTVLWETHLSGAMLFVISRVLPIALSMTLAWWAVRRLGPDVLEPVPMLSVIATSLCFRLVFEENLFGYYFMAVAVALVLLEIMQGRISVYLVGWVALNALYFYPLPWGNDPVRGWLAIWTFQVVLVAGALVMAVLPLRSFIRSREDSALIAVARD